MYINLYVQSTAEEITASEKSPILCTKILFLVFSLDNRIPCACLSLMNTQCRNNRKIKLFLLRVSSIIFPATMRTPFNYKRVS